MQPTDLAVPKPGDPSCFIGLAVPTADIADAARRIFDGKGADYDIELLSSWYFAGRVSGPGPGLLDVAATALMAAGRKL